MKSEIQPTPGDLADAAALLGLLHLPDVGDRAILNIIARLQAGGTGIRFLLEYDAADLVAEELLSEELAHCFTSDEEREWRNVTLDALDRERVHLVPITSEAYPVHLRAHPWKLPPVLLCVRGALDVVQITGVAFAGARTSSDVGLEAVKTLVEEAVKYRFPIVSGGARGADWTTHEEAVRLGGMTTIVLPEGILSTRARTMSEHLQDAHAAIVSTYEPQQPWQNWAAMHRNRTILGLSDRLVVVEAGERGGTMNAARDALNRDIPTWVLDFEEFPETAAGNRVLIDAGAKSVPVSADLRVSVPLDMFAIHNWVIVPQEVDE